MSLNQSTFGLGLVDEGLVDREAVAGLADAGLERAAERPGAVALAAPAAQVAGVPGTPAEMPLKRASSKGSGAPFSQNESGRIVAGDSSRPSIVVTFPPAVRMTMKPPPPMPHE